MESKSMKNKIENLRNDRFSILKRKEKVSNSFIFFSLNINIES